jgi:hypothetical protein
MKLPRLYRFVYRSAVDGRFVTREYAETYPTRTIRQRLWFWQKEKAS